MARDAESSGTAVDRISNMPRNIIDLILERLSIHEAAQMGVLSKTWWDIWETNPHLVFDMQFFMLRLRSTGNPDPSDNSRIISTILLAHNGPILNFNLYIPPLLRHWCLEKDLWIKNISKTRLKNLEVSNSDHLPYQIPSSLFSCSDLTRLKLFRCILNPPRTFEGFSNLVNVQLDRVKITADMSFGTQLEELALYNCTGIEHLGCQFKHGNNLTLLEIIYTGDFDLGRFECMQKVTNLSLTIECKLGGAGFRTKIINLDKLFSNMPRINTLHLCGFTLEAGPAVSERPITTLENLYLRCFGVHDLNHMQYVLCLIKCSPNLRYLYISLPEVKSSDDMDLMALWGNMILDQLESVEMDKMVGTRPAFQFVKVLLASTPSLRLLKLNKKSSIEDPKEELRIARALLLFPRASRSAQVIWA